MGYNIKYQEMKEYESQIKEWARALKEEFRGLECRFRNMATEERIAGNTVNAIRNYISRYHLRALEGLEALVNELEYRLHSYIAAYQSEIDASEQAVFCEDAFVEYMTDIQKQEQRFDYFREQMEIITRSVNESDIRLPSDEGVKFHMHGMMQKLERLAEEVVDMENRHLSDTDEPEVLAEDMTAFINNYCLSIENAGDASGDIQLERIVDKLTRNTKPQELDVRINLAADHARQIRTELGITEVFVTAEMLKKCGWSEDVLTEEMVADLNRVLSKYQIDTPERIYHFLAQCSCESNYGRALVEITPDGYLDNKSYDTNTRGGGYIQLTNDYGYWSFATYLILEVYPELENRERGAIFLSPAHNSTEAIYKSYQEVVSIAEERGIDVSQYTAIVDGAEVPDGFDENGEPKSKEITGPEYVAAYYPWESSGYFWTPYNEINRSIVDGVDFREISIEITHTVTGVKYDEDEVDHRFNERWESYTNMVSVDIFNYRD